MDWALSVLKEWDKSMSLLSQHGYGPQKIKDGNKLESLLTLIISINQQCNRHQC